MPSSRPAARHVAHAASDESRTWVVRERMRPLRSATGMNPSGETQPRSGCCQRTSASTPTTTPEANRACGCTWTWMPSFCSAVRSSDTSARRRGLRVPDPYLQAIEYHREFQCAQHPCCDLEHLVLVGGVGQGDGELVAAEPDDSARLGNGRAPPGADLHEQEVALLVPEDVVDLLEPVEVQDHHRDTRGAAGIQPVECRREPALQEHPVRQAGQAVVQCLMPELVDQLAVLQGNAGLVGHGLQHPQVDLPVGADVAQPVGHDQDPGHAVSAAQRNDDRLAPGNEQRDAPVDHVPQAVTPRAARFFDPRQLAVRNPAGYRPLPHRTAGAPSRSVPTGACPWPRRGRCLEPRSRQREDRRDAPSR
jgi:hypothetical protein